MKILITNIVNYKEKDAIIAGFNETGVFSILVKGMLNPKSKNACLNNVMTIADIEINDAVKLKHDVMKSAELVFSPLELLGDLTRLSMVMILDELIVKCLNDEEKTSLYKDFYYFIKNIKKNKVVKFSYLNLIAKILNSSGYSFDINECTSCGGKKDIVGFSMNDGGFVCKQCLINANDASYSKEELIWLRKIFRIDTKDKPNFENDIEKDSFKKLLRMMLIFIEDNYGLKLTNTELILG